MRVKMRIARMLRPPGELFGQALIIIWISGRRGRCRGCRWWPGKTLFVLLARERRNAGLGVEPDELRMRGLGAE